MSIGLTQVQANCLAFLREYSNANGVMPTFDEIKDHFGWAAKSGVSRVLEGLEERGAIRRAKNVRSLPRAIEIIPESEQRTVLISESLWPLLIAYCTAEQVTVETAVGQFIRDALESA